MNDVSSDVSSDGIFSRYTKQLIGTPSSNRNVVIVVILMYIVSIVFTITKVIQTKRYEFDPIQLYYLIITVTCISFALIASYVPFILGKTNQTEMMYHHELKYIILLYLFLITPIFLRLAYKTFGRKNPKDKILNLLMHPAYFLIWFIVIYIIQHTDLFMRIPRIGFLFEAIKLDNLLDLRFFEVNVVFIILVLLGYILLLFVSKITSAQALSILCRKELNISNGLSKIDDKCFQTLSIENMYIPYFISCGFMFYKFVWVPFSS
jgi:hypothetical protein